MQNLGFKDQGNEKFSKSYRLLSKKEFENLREGSEKFFFHPILCFYKLNFESTSSGYSRIGFSVSKKIGKAHERNTFKRILREHYRKDVYLKSLGLDFLVVLVKKPENSTELLRSFKKFSEMLKRHYKPQILLADD